MIPPVDQLGRIGPILSAETWLALGESQMVELKELGGLRPEHDVLDIGCGFGRIAIQLTQFLDPSARYVGIDIVPEMVAWCTDEITSRYPAFEFRRIDVHNQHYHPGGTGQASRVRLPAADSSADLVFLFSVFTHMYPADVRHYLREIRRCLKPGGRLMATYFLINDAAQEAMAAGHARFNFIPQDGYYVKDLKDHEAAVGYDESVALREIERAGFEPADVHFQGWSRPTGGGQDIVVARKPLRPQRWWSLRRAASLVR